MLNRGFGGSQICDSTHYADRLATIRRTFEAHVVMIDTHTADGLKVAHEHTEPGVPMIVLETALPVKFAAGTHTFKAAAIDMAGNQDTTPVAATFTSPINNTELGHSKGWTKAKLKGTFLKTASVTKKKGAKVATKATGVTRIALIASKGKGFGTVKVMLGKKTLKKVSLAHKRSVKKKVIGIAKFATPVNGKVTVQVAREGLEQRRVAQRRRAEVDRQDGARRSAGAGPQ